MVKCHSCTAFGLITRTVFLYEDLNIICSVNFYQCELAMMQFESHDMLLILSYCALLYVNDLQAMYPLLTVISLHIMWA